MRFNFKHFNFKEKDNTPILFGIFQNHKNNKDLDILNNISKGYIYKILSENIQGNIGEKLIIYKIPNIIFRKIIVLGCGDVKKFNELQYLKLVKIIFSILRKEKISDSLISLKNLTIKNLDTYWKIRKITELIYDLSYSFNFFKKNKENFKIKEITFLISSKENPKKVSLAIDHAKIISKGIKIAKDLSNLPSNICNSQYINKKVKKIFQKYKNVSLSTIDERKMKKDKMNSYLAVNQGSSNPAIISIILLFF